MVIWRASYHDDWEGQVVVWAETKREVINAAHARAGCKRPLDLFVKRFVIRNPAELVRWLSVHCGIDNG